MRAVRYEQSKELNDKRKKPKGATMVYPAGSQSEHRTHDRHLELADRVNPHQDGPEYFGVKEGRSFLVNALPEINLIDDLVIDYMHNCLLGKNIMFFLLCILCIRVVPLV